MKVQVLIDSRYSYLVESALREKLEKIEFFFKRYVDVGLEALSDNPYGTPGDMTKQIKALREVLIQLDDES